MTRTVQITRYISAQGVFVRHLPDGRAVVRDGAETFKGTLIEPVRSE